MQFLTSLPSQKIVIDYHRSLPALTLALQYIQEQYPDSPFNPFIQALPYSRLQPITIHWMEMNRIMERGWGYLLNNEVSPAACLLQIEQEIRAKKLFLMR